MGVTTSINLYDYSFKNNIEFGVFSEFKLLDNFTQTVDKVAWNTCMGIATENEVVFIKRPVMEKRLLSSILGKSYVKSDILLDNTDKFYTNGYFKRNTGTFKKMHDFPDEIELGSSPSIRPEREDLLDNNAGYCIRTGERIPFNPKAPYCEKAFKS